MLTGFFSNSILVAVDVYLRQGGYVIVFVGLFV